MGFRAHRAAVKMLPFMKKRVYPINIEIRKPRAAGMTEIEYDIGRKVKFEQIGKGEEITYQLELYHRKFDTILPANYLFEIDQKGRQKVYLSNPQGDVLIPLTPPKISNKDEMEQQLMIEGRMSFILAKIKQNEKDIRSESWLMKYMPYVTSAMLLVGAILVAIFLGIGIEKFGSMINSGLNTFAAALEKIAPSIPPPV